MPFSKPAKYKIKKDCVSLQVHKSDIDPEKNRKLNCDRRKRVCLFTFSDKETKKSVYDDSRMTSIYGDSGMTNVSDDSSMTMAGSVTIEASIAIVLFMMVILFMINFMVAINAEINMQIKINNVAKQIAKNMFYVGLAEENSQEEEETADIKTKEEAVGQAILLYNMAGVDVSESSIENGIVDIVARQQVRIPLINKKISLYQRALMKDWTGTDITKSSDIVYITKNGTVYHRSKNCSHLIVHISKTTVGQVEQFRNANGAKYSKCLHCVTGELSPEESVFITEDGNKYHSSLQCRGITRSIIEVDISQVGDKKPCSECGQGG